MEEEAFEEAFEEVGLNDEVKPKKKGFLSRFGDSSNDAQAPGPKTSTSSFGFHPVSYTHLTLPTICSV